MKSFFYILFFTLLSFEGLAQINFPALSGRNENAIPILAATTAASSITITSTTSGGDITSDGGSTIITKGLIWSTSSSPTIALSTKTTESSPSSLGAFMSSLTNLTPNTTYYLRSYATNKVGTGYGNEVSFKTSSLITGTSYQGGFIFYIDGTGQHGLIAANEDLPTLVDGNGGRISGYKWCNCTDPFNTIKTGTVSSNGSSNTTTIISKQGGTGNSYAAIAARSYRGGGYTDWYLPSIEELQKLSPFTYAGDGSTINGFIGSDYWSSTENLYNKRNEPGYVNGDPSSNKWTTAYYLVLGSGLGYDPVYYTKVYDGGQVRPIRAF